MGKKLITLALGTGLTLGGCMPASCPNDVSTLHTNYNIFSEMVTGQGSLGFGGYNLGTPDNLSLVRNCGFEFYNGHRGGLGDTLEMINSDNTIYMKWAYDALQNISVRQGWEGQTSNGLQIGDDVSKFLKIYPNAVRGTLNNVWVDEHLKIETNDAGEIDAMELSDLPYDKNANSFSRVGPVGWWK